MCPMSHIDALDELGDQWKFISPILVITCIYNARLFQRKSPILFLILKNYIISGSKRKM